MRSKIIKTKDVKPGALDKTKTLNMHAILDFSSNSS